MSILKWKKISLLLGGLSFLIVFVFNLRINLILTSFYRGVIAFCIFFLLGIIISLFFNYSFSTTVNNFKGTNIDLKTSNDEDNNIDYNEIYNISNENTFKPLLFNKIESSEEKIK